MGSQHRIALQTMTTTDTRNVQLTVDQVRSARTPARGELGEYAKGAEIWIGLFFACAIQRPFDWHVVTGIEALVSSDAG